MAELLIRHGEWVVVCDGAKALILENSGDTKFPNLKTIKVLEQKDLPTHALGTDAPGRTNNSIGRARSAVEQTDWHDQSERAAVQHRQPFLFIWRSSWTAPLRPERPSLSLWWRHRVRWA